MDFAALLGDAEQASATLSALGTDGALSRALHALAEQAIHRGIDYKTLGLNWDHPQTRIAYRKAEGSSFSKPASRARQQRSRLAIHKLAVGLLAAAADRREQLLVGAFCEEIGAPNLAQNATFAGVLAALDAELLLPLRAFSEATPSMFTTFGGQPIPHEPIEKKVHELLEVTLANRFSEWRYTNPIGAAQLAGLSDAQIAKWREPSRTKLGDLLIHEDTEGELGFWWATKIGGPSHGFDLEGQCLLPLLCNARHKVILVTDPAYPHNPSGRAHFRLLWVHGSSPPRAILWLETVNADFAARVNTRAWLPAVLQHAASKAASMGLSLSVESYVGRELARVVREHLEGSESDVTQVQDRLVLRPSNGVVEASDYLTNKHDWVQMEEETTQPLRRALYTPKLQGHVEL
uniref:Uncharacterized protein n=1 Tax=Haptolina brevifila TaxID=156173 RepID=A0A7S2FKV9_9EUKA|mmetsp:Transcript_13252/g.26639  ORF Transcript_13252/g.26639 Transcript_13252/m.26639 type:complete len:406 (+) Transcript_13252:116-1333(+)